jgi:predicted transcriptional regulator
VKTTTIRLDDDLMELIDEVAGLTRRPASDVMRAGIREYMRTLADQDQKIREIRDGIAQRRIEAQTNATRRNLGMDPIDSPANRKRNL